jgi:hypothetical protein
VLPVVAATSVLPPVTQPPQLDSPHAFLAPMVAQLVLALPLIAVLVLPGSQNQEGFVFAPLLVHIIASLPRPARLAG